MIRFSIPIKTVNEANGSHGHWAAKASRRKKQRIDTKCAFFHSSIVHMEEGSCTVRLTPPPPYRVTLTRVSAGLLDTDALPLSLKSIRDQIAEELGVTDGPTDDRVTWAYAQKKCKRGQYSVEVEIA